MAWSPAPPDASSGPTPVEPRESSSAAELPARGPHPDDGWVLADPEPMSRGMRRALRGLVEAIAPLRSGPSDPELVERVETQVRRLLRYMPGPMALGFRMSVRLLNLAPLWRFRALRPLHRLERDRAVRVLRDVSHSRLTLLRKLVMPVRAAILSTYFDQPEVHARIGYAPEPWARDRIALRRRLLAAEQPAGGREEPPP